MWPHFVPIEQGALGAGGCMQPAGDVGGLSPEWSTCGR